MTCQERDRLAELLARPGTELETTCAADHVAGAVGTILGYGVLAAVLVVVGIAGSALWRWWIHQA